MLTSIKTGPEKDTTANSAIKNMLNFGCFVQQWYVVDGQKQTMARSVREDDRNTKDGRWTSQGLLPTSSGMVGGAACEEQISYWLGRRKPSICMLHDVGISLTHYRRHVGLHGFLNMCRSFFWPMLALCKAGASSFITQLIHHHVCVAYVQTRPKPHTLWKKTFFSY